MIESKNNNKLTANELKSSLNLQNICSTSTVKPYLRRNNLFGRVAAKKPLLNSKQRKRRLQWCRERRSWNSTDWRKLIFSDECKLDMHNCTRTYIRRRVGERLKEKI